MPSVTGYTTDAIDNKFAGVTAIAFNRQTASYALVSTDARKCIEMNVGSANTLTVPPNSSVPLPTGTWIDVVQRGTGVTTLTAGAGVTINTFLGYKTAGQYASARLVKVATDEWYLSGDLTT